MNDLEATNWLVCFQPLTLKWCLFEMDCPLWVPAFLERRGHPQGDAPTRIPLSSHFPPKDGDPALLGC